VPRHDNGIAKAFGKRIRSLRMSAGWSQERLASEARMHRTYIWGIERGTRNPSLRHLARLAAALGVSLHVLFKEEKER
jgi:transcriptional regulator with XRE-family HTH domain